MLLILIGLGNKWDEQSVELDLIIQKKNFILFLTVKNAKCTILLPHDLLLPLLDSRSLNILTNWFQHKCFLTICSPTMVVFNKYGMSSLHFNHTTSSKINKPSFPHPNLISFTIVRKENRNLRKIPTPQLVKYKYYKKILHIPQCWYHHQIHARFWQADNKSTAAYTVEEASKVFFTTTVQGSWWVLLTATFCPVQI